MGIPALLRLKQKDIGALVVFGLIGWLIGNTVSDPTWAAYTAFLVCDHLFLGWLVFLGDNRARHPFPIEAILVIHAAFVVLVIVVVAARGSLHFFGLFPFPMVALALWLLSCAVGYEKSVPAPVRLRKPRLAGRAPERRRVRRPLWTGPATKKPRAQNASRPAQPEPPAPAPLIPESAIFKTAVQIPSPANHEVLTVTESPIVGYQPLVSGISLNLQPSLKPAQPAGGPEFYRDDSIATGLRQTYSEDVARFYPTLVATAEDNEAWLDARGKENPTHRKLGMSVREEYEEWLTARLLARAAQNHPVSTTCANGQSQPEQVQV
jgi:hypothetical protein